MSYEFILPILGEKISSGDVVAIKVNQGDKVIKDQPVLELETDKAVIEVPSPISGMVTDIKLKVGDKAKVGQLVMILDEAGDAAKIAETKPIEKKVEPQKIPEVPQVVSAPAEVLKPQVPVKQESEKQMVRQAHHVPVEENGSFTNKNIDHAISKEILAAPSVRALAREMGVDLAQVTGSGDNGRVLADDVKSFVQSAMQSKNIESNSPLTIEANLPNFKKWGEIEVKPMNGVRRATVKSMTQSWTQIPMVTQFESADISDILDLRKKFSKRVEQAGGKLTVTAIILKVVGAALKVFPQFNASIDLSNETIIQKKFINVGVAVDTERGLLVPVIKNVDHKNIVELSVDLNTLAEKARSKKISPDELDGATFTITNLGSIATTHFTPIINWPQVAILGVGRSEVRPVWQNDQWVPRTILPLSLTYDHRLIDGADAGRFLKWLSEALSDLFLLDLEG